MLDPAVVQTEMVHLQRHFRVSCLVGVESDGRS